ncbi:MAG TPA: hypothetical protein VJN71_11355 [Nitrososphaerales archaeon]|nr:hypothetical protein [Nitrososphaerales archaeon]
MRKAWDLSRIPYTEIAYRSVQSSRGSIQSLGNTRVGPSKLFTMVMRSAKISKGAFSIFGTIGAAIPFLDFVVTPGPESLVSAISLSLAISLAYIVFYSLQVLPSFSNAEPFALLSTLPLAESDFSLISLFSFIRSFDLLAVSSGAIQMFAIWFLTGSLVSTAIMLVAVVINVIFAASISLWFSGVFYRNVSRGGRSRKASLGRLLFLIAWGFGALSIAFLFDLVSYILPYLNTIIGSSAPQAGSVLLILHPFPMSMLISSLIYPSLLSPAQNPASSILTKVIIISGVALYVPLAFIVGKRTSRAVSKIAKGSDLGTKKRATSDTRLKLHSPLAGLALKDIRLASKNPSVAFLFALPFFVVFILGIVTSQFAIMHASAMIASTVVGCSFVVMICSTLLSTEAIGMEYTLSLPLRTRQIVNGKAILSTLTFAPVPIALLSIALTRELTYPLLPLIPLLELPSMYAACVAQVSFYMGSLSRKDVALGKSKAFSPMAGGDLKRLAESLALSFAFVIVPLLSYAFAYLLTMQQLSGIVAMAIVSILELVLALRISSN